MKPNLRKKIADAKSGPDYLTRAKIRVDSVMNSYQAQVDNTAIEQPLENISKPIEETTTKQSLITPNLIKAQQWKETGGTFKPDLVSPRGAKGIGQIMPSAWNDAIKKKWISKDADIFNPKDNETVQKRTMEWLLERPGVNGQVDRALAAYNWGIGNFQNHVRKHGDKWYENLKDNPETYQYVSKILDYEKNLEQH